MAFQSNLRGAREVPQRGRFAYNGRMKPEAGHFVRCIVSGGQTGVDRGALDAAIALGIEHGGWCPKGRIAEDGPIPRKYRLRETASPLYRFRTAQNVLDSDGTLILFRERLFGGTLLTHRLARRHRKPCLAIDLADPGPVATVAHWLHRQRIGTLNVAGPRESSAPGITQQACEFLRSLLGPAGNQERIG